MKKALLISISAALFATGALPFVASAQTGGTCINDSQCPSNEYCDTSIGSCLLRPGGGAGGGGSGSLNTALLQGWAQSIIYFINIVLVPLLTALAFIVFLWGVYKYFIYGADNEDSRKEGKTFVLYGIIGFVIIFSLWGLVNVGVSLLNVGTGSRPGTLPYPTL